MINKIKAFWNDLKGDFNNHRNQYIIILSVTAALFLAFIITLVVQIYGIISTSNRTNHTNTLLSEVEGKLSSDPVIVGDEFSVEAMQEIFGADQLSLIAEKCWDYELLVNGKKITGSNMKISAKDGVNITLREIYNESAFPEEIELHGRVTGNDVRVDVSNYISVTHKDYVEPVKNQKDNVFNLTYTAKDVKSGDTVKINLKPMLSQLLDLPEDLFMSEDPIVITIT